MAGLILGIAFIVWGLVGITPAGARLSMRVNRSPFGRGSQGAYVPKSTTATQIVSAVILVAGIAWIVASV